MHDHGYVNKKEESGLKMRIQIFLDRRQGRVYNRLHKGKGVFEFFSEAPLLFGKEYTHEYSGKIWDKGF